MKKLSILALTTASLVSAHAFANHESGSRAHAVSLTVGGGYEYFASKRNINNTGMPIVALGYNLTDNWSVEAMLSQFKTDFKRKVGDNRNISGNLFAVDAIYHFAAYSMVQPYVLAGPGFTRLNPNRTNATSEGNINLGVGVQTFINPSVGFVLEARDLYTFTGGKNDVLLNAGISFLMDIC